MKQIIFIIACVLGGLTACQTKASEESCCAESCCVANKDSFEIIMNIPMKIKPEFIATFKTAFDKCQAETLKEEACLAYDLFQSYNDSTVFHLFERWANKPGHLAHMETEHLKNYFKEVEGTQDRASSRMITTIVCPMLNEQ